MSIEATIIERLREIEREHDCRVLFAAESGSRAWGFPSPDSDYDARFIYVHPLQWHLQIGKPRDTIEKMLPDGLDVSGWELLKTLQLFHGSNVPLFEWLGSPDVYIEDKAFTNRLRELIPNYFNPKKALHHYLSLANKVYDTELAGRSEVKVKKLFYVLRPLLCARWILQHRSMPPTRIQDVLDGGIAERAIADWILETIEQKRTAAEQQLIEVPNLSANWIATTLRCCQELAESFPLPACHGSQDPLNRLLRQTLDLHYSEGIGEGYVYFALRGDFDTDEVTQRVGLTPTKALRKHEKDPERKTPRFSHWDYSTPVVRGKHVDVYELASQITANLRPHAGAIRQAVQDLGLSATLQVVLYINWIDETPTPAIGFHRDVVQFLADVGATVDIDTYPAC